MCGNLKKSEKLKALAVALDYRAQHRAEIERYELKIIISKTLNFTDAHTINNWVTFLIVKKLISSNDLDKKPTRTSLYKINKEECKRLII